MAAMTEPPSDVAELARRYLDLWQRQVAALAGDPAVATAVARGLALITAGLGGAAAPGSDSPPQEGRAPRDEPAPSPPTESAAPGSASAAAASGDPACDPVRLAGRLAALEARVAALEAAARPGGGGTGGKTRRRRE